ncbi:hypothetical protein TeGR_g3786 [Tetraparma gracilis]|uniref:Uncharacterized protein n=1 Tax=Tetraparma gracilis TaxID=2962635 RepID=A0ABQ6NB76_9STRA|nr:hypothetical protein TeGR_g3786 [Tetraparma gracilis]
MAPVAQDPTVQARAKWIAAKISDRTLRDAFIRAVTDKTLVYSDAERKQIEEGLKMEAEVTNSSALKPIKVSTPLLDKAVAMTSKDGQHNIVQSSAIVRAPLMDVVAYMYCVEQEVGKILNDEVGALTKVLETKNEHCVVMQWRPASFPRPLSNRDGVFCCIYQELGIGEGIISITSTAHAAAANTDNTVRTTGTRLLRFSQVTPTVTRFTATATFDLCGSIPRFISDTLTTPAAARTPLGTLGYFLKIKETAELDSGVYGGQDARALGQLLVHEMEPVRTKKRPEHLEAKLHVFFYRTTVLRELADVHPWFPEMTFQILRNQASAPRTTKAKLADFTERDAVIIGQAVAMLMLSSSTPDAVWIITFPALIELESERPFFRPFVHAVVELLLSITVNSVKMHMYNKEARVEWMAAKIKDRAIRATFIRAVTDNAQEYSEAERKQIEEGLKMEAEVNRSRRTGTSGLLSSSSLKAKATLKPIKVSTPLLDKAVAMTSKGGQHNIVQSSATIRAPLMDVLAFSFCIKETAKLDADGQDARALGQVLMHEIEPVRTKKRPEHLEAKLHTFFYRTTVLRELADVHLWFPEMLFQILRNIPSRPRTTKAKLVDFTERDAVIVGRAMKVLMISNATPNAAVDEWILTFPALQELETAHPFFRPFMNEIAKHILSVADFGLKMRLFSGAGLSVFDIVSDVYMIVVFLGSEETRGVAHVNIACVALSLFWQLVLVGFVNKKRSWRRIACEVLYVVSYLKPGIDAARVAAGNENDDGLAACYPLAELTGSKMIEMVFESIPAAIIQTRAFIISEERSTLALVSIIISCCTTGFAAATMWYDYDTSPEKRRMDPKIAGATPDTSRSPFFILLVMSGAFQVMAKSFSSALFFIASPIYFLAYMAGDHVLYQLYLVVRGDLRSFRPGFSVSLSVVFNTVEKAIADFTSCWLMRNPLSMHSAYFLFNQLTTHASAFVSVRVYVSAGGDHLDERVLWIGAGLLFAAWALTYIILACMVKPEYRHRFYSTETCVQYVRAGFTSSQSDEGKMTIFYRHEVKWRDYKDEVRDFTHANWARWKEEQPAWFDAEVIALVPDEYIPIAALASLNAAAHGGQRRRSSLGLAGSVRQSVRESVRRDDRE